MLYNADINLIVISTPLSIAVEKQSPLHHLEHAEINNDLNAAACYICIAAVDTTMTLVAIVISPSGH